MFSKPIIVAQSLLTIVLAQTLPAPTCIAAGDAPASDCTSFIETFCDNVSAAQNAVRVGDSTGRCYNLDSEPGHSCQFIALNTFTSGVPPSNINCKSVLTSVVTNCRYGGFGSVSANAYRFFLDKNARRCGDLNKID